MPLSFMMGVSWEDSFIVAELIGTKTFLNEFLAFQKLSELIKRRKAGRLEYVNNVKQYISVSSLTVTLEMMKCNLIKQSNGTLITNKGLTSWSVRKTVQSWGSAISGLVLKNEMTISSTVALIVYFLYLILVREGLASSWLIEAGGFDHRVKLVNENSSLTHKSRLRRLCKSFIILMFWVSSPFNSS